MPPRLLPGLFVLLLLFPSLAGADHLHGLQNDAIRDGKSQAAHWGPDPENYTAWGTHSNRLIPVYTFGTKGRPGLDLSEYAGKNSPYRSEQRLRALYGDVPSGTLNPHAAYFDQTAIATIQQAALESGIKHLFLVVFDGMDWQTTRAASVHNLQRVAYKSGRGTGLHFLDYKAAGTTQFGAVVTSPYRQGARTDADTQRIAKLVGLPGGYNVRKAGPTPWQAGSDVMYPIAKASEKHKAEHAYPDSAGTATALCSGQKTFNGAINVDPSGQPVTTVAHRAQERGYAVGVVSSVPISHATPAAAYSHNVTRNDYQDLTRDLLGLPSIAHPEKPLPGVDVLIGCGYGVYRSADGAQGQNFVPGNRYITKADLKRISRKHGGAYVVARRTAGKNGSELLEQAAHSAARARSRLFGFFGTSAGHLPYQTADGRYNPAVDRNGRKETYSQQDVSENPTLAEFTQAALQVLGEKQKGFWLLVEAGDVDWANHANNLDASIGAVNSGDAAVQVITDWVEKHSDWNESVMIVTADHGHYLVLTDPEQLISPR